MTLSDLISRLEKATGPDRELDVDIATVVFDLEWRPYGPRARTKWGYKRGRDNVEIFGTNSVHRYTGSTDAAMTLLPDRHVVDIKSFGDGEWHVEIRALGNVENPLFVGRAMSLAQALTIASLKARQAMGETNA